MFHQWLVCVLLAAPLFVVSDAIPLKQFHDLTDHETARLFQEFCVEFGKNYQLEDYTKRLKIFRQNLEVIDRLNREEKGTATYGITRFADLTYEEFVGAFTGGKLDEEAWKRHAEQMEADSDQDIEFLDEDILEELIERKGALSSEVEIEDNEEDLVQVNGKFYLPKNFDYRKKKAVTPVKDQGICGSCWAFSVMANIEGIWAKKKKKLMNLAEQQLLDCDKVDSGCNGGWMQDAVKELVRMGGVAKTSDYPYSGKEGTCRFKKSMAAVTVSGTKSIAANEKTIAKELVKNGPLSIAVVASSNFQFYQSGIFDPTSNQCSTDKSKVNHGVTIVAYGVEKNGKKLPFWVIKNSWGSSWGDKGYIKVVRGKNACALSSFVSTAYL